MSYVPVAAQVQLQSCPSLAASGYHPACLEKSNWTASPDHLSVSFCLSRVEPTEAGDYKLCFDNSFSTISEKLVFFELIFDSLQDDEEVEGWAEAVEPEEMLDVKMEDIKVCPGGGGATPLRFLSLGSALSPWLGSPLA